MIRTLFLAGAVTASAITASAQAPTPAAAAASQARILLNLDKSNLALQGYDPIAFHIMGRPIEGKSEYFASHLGAIYRFSSATNKALFETEPSKYAPAYGGYCAYGVSRGYTASVDIRTGQIIDGRLILNYSLAIRERFDKDQKGYLEKAEENWPELLAKEGKPKP